MAFSLLNSSAINWPPENSNQSVGNYFFENVQVLDKVLHMHFGCVLFGCFVRARFLRHGTNLIERVRYEFKTTEANIFDKD